MPSQLKEDLLRLKNQTRAKILSRFFKTGKGQYGQGDIFLAITVPQQRIIAIKYRDISLPALQELLLSEIHEFRFTALLILIHKFNEADNKKKKEIVDFYIKNTKYINNWDLVDVSADKILGNYLLQKDRKILYKLSHSENLWERRIAIIATYTFIKINSSEDTLKIAEILLYDKHDLIQKAVGWMLREVGKIDVNIEKEFLNKYYKKMPRTTLRYAIERFNENTRKFYLGKFQTHK